MRNSSLFTRFAKKTAQLIGNAGAAAVVVLQGEAGLTFLEQTASGSLQVTAVYMQPDAAGNFRSVHSRNTADAISGLVMPSQWFCTCSPRSP